MQPDLGPYALLPDFVEFMFHGDNAIMAAAATLNENAYMAERNVSAGSLHKLLVHAMGAQWVWLHRLRQTTVPKMPDQSEVPTRAALQKRWPEVHAALRQFVREQTLDSLNQPLTFINFRGLSYTAPLGQLLLHVTDHGTYHRGQQNTLIKWCGGTFVPLNYYEWWRSQNP